MAPFLILFTLALTLAYVALIGLYALGWKRARPFGSPPGFAPSTTISVVIPARNEAVHIAACLRSVLAQDYPPHLLQIIVADDFSEDDTAALASGIDARVQVVSMKNEPEQEGTPKYKKGALAAGIRSSSGTLIVTTDADCIAPPQWLRSIAALYETKRPAMIVGPVAFISGLSMLHIFQSLDFMSMQGITAAAHALRLGDMANGANLAFTRDAFEQVGGYDDISGLASGDDYLLLHKMRRHFPQEIAYLKAPEAIIQTTAQPTWRAFLQQRIRWASKSGKYGDARLTGILALVYIFNLAILAAAIFGFRNPRWWLIPGIMVAVKWLAEALFLLPVSRFFRKRSDVIWLLSLQPLHIIYIVLAGYLGMLGKYRWKGRELR